MTNTNHRFTYKKIIYICAAILLLTVGLLVITGCSNNSVSSVTNNFQKEMEAMNFENAYKYLWWRADGVSKETFVESCKSIVDSLGVTKISFENAEIYEDGEQAYFSYTIVYEIGTAYQIKNSVQQHIVTESGDHYIEYKHDMLLEGYEPGGKISRVATQGKRGEIFTQDNVAVAVNDYSETVLLNVNKDLDINTVINQLTTVLEITDDKVIADIRSRYNSALEHSYGTSMVCVMPKGSVDDAKRAAILSVNEAVTIDNTSVTSQRYYPYGTVYAHVVGYASTPSEEELATLKEEGYASASLVGKTGIEKQYDRYLQPKDGFRINMYKEDGVFIRTVYEQPAENGADVILTLDSYLQQKATYLLSGYMNKNQTGSSIVMDPTTGFVQAMASGPTFDANIFSFPVSDNEYQKLVSEENGAPLFNRATSGLYAPGSILKPFTVTPALENDIVTRYTVFPYSVSGNKWKPPGTWYWDPVTRNEAPDGPLDLDRAIRFSDNIYFSWVALQMGEEMFMDYMKQIGFGDTVPFDLPVAQSNLINPNDENNATSYNDDGSITRKMLSDMAFGHGNELITPIQAAAMYTAFSADGDIIAPKLVERIEKTNANKEVEIIFQAEKEVWKAGVIKPETLEILNYSMKNVVLSGTAKSLQTKGLTLAAKTGTALKGDGKDTKIAWLAAWYTGMEEQRLVVVNIEGPRKNDDNRHAIAKALLQPETYGS